MIHISEILPGVITGGTPDVRLDHAGLESPIEEKFASVLQAWARPPDRWENQAPIPTAWGDFRLDFLLETRDARRIGFECDGRDFHCPFRDRCRDALILWSHSADEIVRMSGADLTAAPSETFAALVMGRPELFPEALAAPLRRRYGPHVELLSAGEESVLAQVKSERWGRYLRVTLRSRSPWCRSSVWMRQFHDFAWSRRGRSFAQLVEDFLGERTAENPG